MDRTGGKAFLPRSVLTTMFVIINSVHSRTMRLLQQSSRRMPSLDLAVESPFGLGLECPLSKPLEDGRNEASGSNFLVTFRSLRVCFQIEPFPPHFNAVHYNSLG